MNRSNTKLTPTKVMVIKTMLALRMRQQKIADSMGVTQATISRIHRGKQYANIPGPRSGVGKDRMMEAVTEYFHNDADMQDILYSNEIFDEQAVDKKTEEMFEPILDAKAVDISVGGSGPNIDAIFARVEEKKRRQAMRRSQLGEELEDVAFELEQELERSYVDAVTNVPEVDEEEEVLPARSFEGALSWEEIIEKANEKDLLGVEGMYLDERLGLIIRWVYANVEPRYWTAASTKTMIRRIAIEEGINFKEEMQKLYSLGGSTKP